MKKIILNGPSLAISRIGLGTVKFGRNQGVKYPTQFALPTDDEILNLLSLSQELGINLLDTAPAYGISEQRLGKLLKNQRKNWIISSKVGENFSNGESHYDFSKQAVQASVEKSLQHLQADTIDILLVHSNGEDEKIINDYEIFSVLDNLKQQGKIQAYGMSTKTVQGGKLTVDHADVVMVTHNPIYQAEAEVISYAHAKNKAVFIKKAFASGHLQTISESDPVTTVMNFIFQTQGVSSIITGTLNPQHLKESVTKANAAIEKYC